MANVGGIKLNRVISWGLDALGRNALPIFGLAVVLVGIPAFAVDHWTMSRTMSGAVEIGSPLFWLLDLVLAGLLVPLITDGLLAGLVAHIVLRQRAPRHEQGVGNMSAVGMIGALIGLSILTGLIVTIGALLLVVPGVILSLVLIVAVPVLVVERKGVIQAMVRSESLTSGSKVMIFLLLILLFLLSMLISYLAGFLGPLAIELAGPGFVAPALTGAVAETIRSAINAAIVSSLYLELRALKEGDASGIIAEVFE